MAHIRAFLLFGFATALISSTTMPTEAADLGGDTSFSPGPIPQAAPALRWDGLYGGASIGYRFSTDTTTETSAVPYNAVGLEGFSSSANGFTYGAQAGYNVQFGHVVVGVEADLNYANLSRTATSPSGAVTEAGTGGYIGTLRPRLGLAFDRFLVYGTAGLAVGSLDTTVTGSSGNAVSATASNSWQVGWVAGAGVEYMLADHLSLKAEYLHTDLGNSPLTGVGANGATYSWDSHYTDNTVRVGINFHF